MGEGNKPTASAAHSYIIKRPRLTKLLDDSGARLILLVAPAGYGKTTLAREWLSAFQRPVAWYRASTASADVAALATGLAAEIDAAVADGTMVTNDRMTSLAAVQQRPDVLARALRRSRETWPARLVVAIDDYHQLSGSDAAETFVGEMVSLLPATFVITTRTRPSWFSPRLSIYGDAVEVGTPELTMTEDEARQVFAASSQPARTSTLDLARGWPVVIGLAARTGRTEFPSEALPRNLYEFLAEDLIRATTPETQQALTIIALTGTNEQPLIRELVGSHADLALDEAEKRGLLAFENASRVVLHPLLGEFLIERLRQSERRSIDAIVVPLTHALKERRRWDECLAVAEAMPASCRFASTILEHSLQEQLDGGRVRTVRRWVALARSVNLDAPIVELAEAEVALLAGDYDRALAMGSHAASRRTSRDLRSRAELVAGRGAHLADQRSVAISWFRIAETSAQSRHVRTEALWGQFVVAHDEEADNVEPAFERFAEASDGTTRHRMRLAQGRVMLGLTNRDVHQAIEAAEEGNALALDDCDPYARLAILNQSAWIFGYAARYEEALQAGDHLVADADAGGIDFARNHGLLANARALVGLRRFADARDVLNQVITRLRLEPDPWAYGDLTISEARLQISLGDLDRAKDVLSFDPDRRTPVTMWAEYDAYRALVEAARGESDSAHAWLERSQRSIRIEARAIAWMAEEVLRSERQREARRRVSGIDRVFKSGFLDAIVIGCRAHPELARRSVADGHRDALMAVLRACGDRPLARAAGLVIPRMPHPSAALSPRELEVYELMIQGRTNREIGRNLYITESTTKVHVRHILEKLGVRSRVEAVRAWRPTVPTDSSFDDAG